MRVFPVNYRCGLTLVEVLVVVFVIGIIAALVLPAVQAARETARRAQCANNLKEIGISINNFVSSEQKYPQGGNAYSPFVRMLPYIEQKNLYNSINFNEYAIGMNSLSANKTAYTTRLDVFVCPSDGSPDAGHGPSNYGGNFGVGFGPGGVARNGPFASTIIRPAIGPERIRDGLSHTVAVSEILRNRDPDQRHRKRSVFMPGVYGRDQFHEFLERCRGLDPRSTPINPIIKGQWYFDGLGLSLYNHNIEPNGHTCFNGDALMGAWTATSGHSGGVNTLFLDGHVKFTKDAISVKTWHAIGSMDGGEIDQTR